MSNRPELLEAIRLATLAPSSRNTQPWTFTMLDGGVAIFPDVTRRLPVVDPHDRELYVGLGCALENLIIASRHAGLEPRVDYFPANLPAAIMVRTEPRTAPAPPDLEGLFAAIPARQSTRRAYEPRAIPAEHLAALDRAARQDGVMVYQTSTRSQIDAIAGLVETATRAQLRNSAYRNELVSWIRFNLREAEDHGDGLTYAALGRSRAPRWLGAAAVKTLVSATRAARREARLVQGAPALMVFAAREDDKRHWVEVGRSFERVALTATSLGIRYAPATMPCEVDEVRRKLQAQLGLGLAEPVVLIRLGYGRPRSRSPRRPLDDVVLRRPVRGAG
jgi:nitroreductase